jgi:glycosyltransferase involved in cell wall biosynthesis
MEMNQPVKGAVRRAGPFKLNILMVAPQPFFRPRGTPFSVLHRIRALGEAGCTIDLITYPFGENVDLPGLNILRASRVPFVKDVKIGPSFAKLLLDIPLAWKTWRALRSKSYDLIHSHEEAAFFCAPLAARYGLPHVYDMHSSLPQQLDNFKSFNLSIFRALFAWLERRVLTTCDGIITICQDLADIALRESPRTPHSMIENTADDTMIFAGAPPTTATAVERVPGRRMVLYTGTFEPYQGIDLLLEAFVTVASQSTDAHLVLVGGRPHQVAQYQAKAVELGIGSRTTFVGQVHPSRIPAFIHGAELIVSPRSSGTNTPLKIYGYLRSGRPIVATNLHTHTQTLNSRVSELVPATPAGLAAGILKVLSDPAHARTLADAARQLSDAEYSDEAYMRKVLGFYERVIRESRKLSAHALSLSP